MTPPSSAPPVFTPPDVPEFVLADEISRAIFNGDKNKK